MIRTIAFLLIAGLFLGACGDKAADSDGGTEKQEEHDEHAHAAKHGGDLVALGAHEGFIEVKLDHAAGTVTIWPYLGEEMKDVKLSKDPAVREFALRAMADRKTQNTDVPADPFLEGLKSKDPRVQVAAAVGIGRLGNAKHADALLAISNPPSSVAGSCCPSSSERLCIC